jgi:hypothetical protein
VFVALNPGALPARERPAAELFQWVLRDEEYAILGANVVVELNSESRARKPTTRRGRSSDGPTASSAALANAKDAPTAATPIAPVEPTASAVPTSLERGRWLLMLADLLSRPPRQLSVRDRGCPLGRVPTMSHHG